MTVKPLKWTKAQWQADQREGKWTPPSDNSSKEIEQWLDKYHKSIFHKRKKKLEAMDKLRELLDAYSAKNRDGDSRVLNIIEKRLNQVVKKRLNYKNADDFVMKLLVKQILDNSYLLEAFSKFL